MGPLDQLLHIAGFLAPALFMGLLLPALSRVLLRKSAPLLGFWLQAAVLFVAAAAVLAAGLWWFGRDGKMATYGALVAVTACTQWILLRGWR